MPGFRQWAWGEDELRPVSKQGLQWMRLGLTIVDSLVRAPTQNVCALLCNLPLISCGQLMVKHGMQRVCLSFSAADDTQVTRCSHLQE